MISTSNFLVEFCNIESHLFKLFPDKEGSRRFPNLLKRLNNAKSFSTDTLSDLQKLWQWRNKFSGAASTQENNEAEQILQKVKQALNI